MPPTHVAGMTRRLSPRWNARVYIRQPNAQDNSRKSGRDRGSKTSARGSMGYGRYSPRTSRLVGRLYRRKQWSYLALGSVLGRLI